MSRTPSLLFCTVLAFSALPAHGADFDVTIPMHDHGAVTYYVQGQLDGVGTKEFMVDTGSSYVTVGEETLTVLKEQGRAEYLKNISGVMADGSRRTVPIYRVTSLDIGGRCVIRDVDVAVFSRGTRHILGLSALKKAAPFALSVEPPKLMLSNCDADHV